MIDGEYEKLLDLVFYPESYTENEIKEAKEKVIERLKELKEANFYKDIEKAGGVDKIITAKNENGNVVEYTNDDKTQANVKVEIICKNGDTINAGRTPVILQNSEWKLKMGYI